MDKIRLSRLIFRYYTRIAIAALLTLTILMVVIYFGTTTYIEQWMRETLEQQVLEVGGSAARATATTISRNFDLIKKGTRLFAQTREQGGSQTKTLAALYRFMQEQTPNVADAYFLMDGEAINRPNPFISIGDAKNIPQGGAKWTGVYSNPDGLGLTLSCVAPVYRSGRFFGMVGLDVTVQGLARALGDLNLPWEGSSCLIDEHGQILAADHAMKVLLGLDEVPIVEKSGHWQALSARENMASPNLTDLSITKIENPRLREGLEKLLQGSRGESPLVKVATGNETHLFGSAIIPGTGWRVLFEMNESVLFRSFNEFLDQARRVGIWVFWMIALFYAGFFVIQWNRARRIAEKIARPLERLSLATADLGTDGETDELPDSGVMEIDLLSENFRQMSASLAEKTRELIQARVTSELKGKETELAYTRGLYQSAAANLHDAGNAVTVLESSLIDLNKVMRSTEQYPEVFKRLRHGGPASSDTLRRFEQVLVGETVPRLRSLAAAVSRLKGSIKRSIQEQQAIFRVIKRHGEFRREFSQASEEMDLSALLMEMCALFAKDYAALEYDIAPGIIIRSHKTHLWAGIDNVMRNAIEASPLRGPIRVSAAATAKGAVVVVADHGEGASPETLGRVGERGYTTKPHGHGLGLNSFREFLEFFGGSLKVCSEGLGKGTEITMEICDA